MAVGSFVRVSAPWIGADRVYSADMPAVDYDAIEAFLKKITANQPIANLTLIRQAQPSPIPGILEVKFTVETNGQRQSGTVYLSGTKMILGQIFDLTTQQNLTAQRAGAPEQIHYDIKTLDLNDRVPRGKPGGRLVIVEFSDFQCPFCKQATGPIAELLKKYPQDVVLYYKHLPLSEIHPLAYKMALASECARAQKVQAFWSFHDRFFADPPIRDESQLREQSRQLADQLGLETDKFLSCYDKGEQAPRVEKDMADARKIGVTATPTFLLNGEFVAGAQPLEMFERYLKEK
jgi:protein-disulfide isomerase